MADKKNVYTIYEENGGGTVQISDEVFAVVAALAATEVEGVASTRDGLSGSNITKSGMKALSKSVKVSVADKKLTIQLVLNIKYGYSIPEVTKKVQEKVKDTLENMMGLKVESVHVSIADVVLENAKKGKKA